MDTGQKKPPGLWGKPGGEYSNVMRMAAPLDSAEFKPERQHRLPAYGRDLLDAQRAGYNVPYLVLSLGWNFGRGQPRLVIPDDLHIDELDLQVVAGLDCLVVHHDLHVRAFDVAELALTFGARICPVYDMSASKTTFLPRMSLIWSVT